MTTITEFANELYSNSRDKGFYEHEDWLRTSANAAEKMAAGSFGQVVIIRDHLATALQEHYGNRLLLIAGEAVEAHEELRAGHLVADLYFSGDLGEGQEGRTLSPEWNGARLKPEGVLAELADVAIRSLETIAGILANLTDGEAATLRSQVPTSEHSDVNGEMFPGPVNVAEILNLKHQFNLSRAAKHGGKKF